MADGKLQVAVGGVSFSGEGETGWLTTQFDKFLKDGPSLAAASAKFAPKNGAKLGGEPAASGDFSTTLAKHIREKNAETNQNRRFLATADWLRLKGVVEITTAAVSKALSDNQQKRLGNPADCLNQNVAKGFCEKSGKNFYITPEGLKELGYQE